LDSTDTQQIQNKPQNFLLVNVTRLVVITISTIFSFLFDYEVFQEASLIFFGFALFWLLSDEFQWIPESKYPYSVFIPTFLDLIIISVFMYFTGTYYSMAIAGFLYTTAVCSLNLKVPQGLFSVILSILFYSGLSLLVHLKVLPFVNVFGEDIHLKREGLFINIALFSVCTIALHLIVKNLSVENKKLLVQKEAEKEKADFANQVKSLFLANMSHEIRTPMNGILGMASLLKDSSLNVEQHEYLDSILSSGNSLLRIINDILDFSKIESGKIEIEYIPFQIRSFRTELTSLFLSEIQEKHLTLEFFFDANIPEEVLLDSTRLRQVLINLVGNSIKFSKTAGKISVSVSVIENFPLKILFSVKDNGIGISQDKITKLFSPFEQLDRSKTRKFGGTGLGLAISKRLVELMKGEFKVKSIENEETVFSFFIEAEPIQFRSVSQNIQNPRHPGDFQIRSDLKILVVDDNPINQKLASKLLEKINLSVEQAYDGLEAVEKVKRDTYDLIFMDMQMPVMDGITATNEIQKLNPNPFPRIVAMTANAFQEDIELCKGIGMFDFLPKPIDRDKLYAILENISKSIER